MKLDESMFEYFERNSNEMNIEFGVEVEPFSKMVADCYNGGIDI